MSDIVSDNNINVIEEAKRRDAEYCAQFEETTEQLRKEAEAEAEAANAAVARGGVLHALHTVWEVICAPKTLYMYIYFALLAISSIRQTVWSIAGILRMDWKMVTPTVETAVVLILLILGFAISTYLDEFNFHLQKNILIIWIMSYASLSLIRILYVVLWQLVVVAVTFIPILEPLNKRMMWILAFYFTVAPTVFFAVAATHSMISLALSERAYWLSWRLKNYITFNPNRKWQYNLTTLRKLSTGAEFVVEEKTRLLHMFTIGSSGTGKTSSIIEPQALSDLDQRVKNEDMLKRKLQRMVERGEAYVCENPDKAASVLTCIKPHPGFESKYQRYVAKYKVCGFTFIAPNDELLDTIYAMCEARNITCNRVDPALAEGERIKDGFIGMNPYYVSPDLPKNQKKFIIMQRAMLCATIFDSLHSMEGAQDVYFSGINRRITTAVSIALMLTHSMLPGNEGLIPTLDDFLNIINDFDRIRPYYNKLIEIDEDNTYLFVRDFIRVEMLPQDNDSALLGNARSNMRAKINDEDTVVGSRRQTASKIDTSQHSMYGQSRGLRNIVTEVLANQQVKGLLCSQRTVDLDKMLANGEVTVVNYALNLGSTASTCLGYFFLLSLIDAVVRRPGTSKTRLPHFVTLDELSLLIHPSIETCYSLWRQYGVSFHACTQSLSQFAKSTYSSYLKDVIVGSCATTVLFGRCSIAEMEYYEKLAGKEYVSKVQYTVTETALSLNDPSQSQGEREMITQDNVLDGGDMRTLSFQEVTVFGVQNNNPLRPFFAKSNFMDRKKAFRKINRFEDRFMDYYEPVEPSVVPAALKESIETLPDVPKKPVTGSVIADHKEGVEPKKATSAPNMPSPAFTVPDFDDIFAGTSNPSSLAESVTTEESEASEATCVEPADANIDNVETSAAAEEEFDVWKLYGLEED